MNVKDLIIDSNASVGKKLILTAVSPVHTYVNNARTNDISGYRYEVVMVDRMFCKVSVVIKGDQLLESPEIPYDVKFSGLELFVYFSSGEYKVGARATGISKVENKPDVVR